MVPLIRNCCRMISPLIHTIWVGLVLGAMVALPACRQEKLSERNLHDRPVSKEVEVQRYYVIGENDGYRYTCFLNGNPVYSDVRRRCFIDLTPWVVAGTNLFRIETECLELEGSGDASRSFGLGFYIAAALDFGTECQPDFLFVDSSPSNTFCFDGETVCTELQDAIHLDLLDEQHRRDIFAVLSELEGLFVKKEFAARNVSSFRSIAPDYLKPLEVSDFSSSALSRPDCAVHLVDYGGMEFIVGDEVVLVRPSLNATQDQLLIAGEVHVDDGRVCLDDGLSIPSLSFALYKDGWSLLGTTP